MHVCTGVVSVQGTALAARQCSADIHFHPRPGDPLSPRSSPPLAVPFPLSLYLFFSHALSRRVCVRVTRRVPLSPCVCVCVSPSPSVSACLSPMSASG